MEEKTSNAQGVPEDFVLEQNFSNPFALSAAYSLQTAIRFGLPVITGSFAKTMKLMVVR